MKIEHRGYVVTDVIGMDSVIINSKDLHDTEGAVVFYARDSMGAVTLSMTCSDLESFVDDLIDIRQRVRNIQDGKDDIRDAG